MLRGLPHGLSFICCVGGFYDRRDHVLDIGCGWGAFAMHAASTRGCRVTGITIRANGGLIGLQAITMPDHRFDAYQRHGDWIQKYSSLAARCRRSRGCATRWRAAFFENLESVRGLGFDDRFVRMWEFYLASCEAMFRTRMLAALQLVLARAR